MTEPGQAAPALRQGYFDALYAADPDPWQFESSGYEDAKYASTLAALGRPWYARGLEVGCSIGVLTARLGARCGALLGIDVADAALGRAAARCASQPHIGFQRSQLPETPPPGRFDLLVFSEVLYYFDPPRLARLAEATRAMAADEAEIMLVHWLGPTPDYPLTGEEAAEGFIGRVGGFARVTQQARTPEYRLDRLVVTGG